MNVNRSKALAFLLFLLPFSAAWAQVDLLISPARLELRLPPGGVWTGEVAVKNGLPKEESLSLLLTPFTLGEDGTPLPGGERDLCPHLELLPTALVLPPGGEARVRLSLRAPAGEGTYACMVFFTGTPRVLGRGLTLSVRPQVGLAVYATLEGTERPAFKAQVGGEGRALPLLLENPGNVLLRLSGEVRILSLQGEEVARLGFADLPLFPGGRRRLALEPEPEPPLPPGRYRAVLLASTPYGEYAAEGVWVVP